MTQQSTNLIRLDSPDPRIAGFLITFPSSVTQEVTWNCDNKITDTLSAAKNISIRIVETQLRAGNEDDVRNTNWASVTAAIQRILTDWQDRLPKPQTTAQ